MHESITCGYHLYHLYLLPGNIWTLLEGLNIYATGDHVRLSNPLVHFRHLLYFWMFGDGSLLSCVMCLPRYKWKKTRAMSGVQTLSLLISYLLSVICYLYELPCKIWSLYLKKLVRYCTRHKRGYLSYVFFILLVLCLQVIIQSKLLSSFVGSLDNYTPLLIMK